MSKIPDCDRCRLYTHQIYFVCAVHPEGVETEKCPDFRPDPEAIEDKELWSPVGYSWYGDELIPDRLCRYTREEQEKILDTHPFFTGVCPDCQHIFSPAPHHIWQCPECGWWESGLFWFLCGNEVYTDSLFNKIVLKVFPSKDFTIL